MKVLCHREGLLSAFQLAGGVVPARDLKPVLRNVKAVAQADRCTLSGDGSGVRYSLRRARCTGARDGRGFATGWTAAGHPARIHGRRVSSSKRVRRTVHSRSAERI